MASNNPKHHGAYKRVNCELGTLWSCIVHNMNTESIGPMLALQERINDKHNGNGTVLFLSFVWGCD